MCKFLNLPQLKTTRVFLYPLNDSPNKAIQGQAPFLAGVPPTMRLILGTPDIPHPSSGVSKRPLISDRTTASPISFKHLYFDFNISKIGG